MSQFIVNPLDEIRQIAECLPENRLLQVECGVLIDKDQPPYKTLSEMPWLNDSANQSEIIIPWVKDVLGMKFVHALPENAIGEIRTNLKEALNDQNLDDLRRKNLSLTDLYRRLCDEFDLLTVINYMAAKPFALLKLEEQNLSELWQLIKNVQKTKIAELFKELLQLREKTYHEHEVVQHLIESSSIDR